MSIVSSAKDVLRRNSTLYSLNARLKAQGTKRRYRSLKRLYQLQAEERGLSYKKEDVPRLVRERLHKRGVEVSPKAKGDLRLIFVGTEAIQDWGGLIQGLQKFAEVIVFEGRPGFYGQLRRDGSGKSVDPARNGESLIALAQKALAQGPLDAVIGQMWGHTMPPQALTAVGGMGIPIVSIAMDDRHTFGTRSERLRNIGTGVLSPSLDLACTTAPECCLWYQAEGCPAIFFPEASDPQFFSGLAQPKEHDVCFVGARYGVRAEIVEALQANGIEVMSYGRGWPNGQIPIEDVPGLFARSRIVLGVGTIGHTRDMVGLKLRDFDAPMSGSFYLTQDNPDLSLVYEIGKEIETYETIEECVAKAQYFLSHEEEREVIARAGRARAERDHTWEGRFESLLRTLGLLS